VSYFDDRHSQPHPMEHRTAVTPTAQTARVANGFREFSQQKAPPDKHLLDLLDLAKAYISEDFDREFHFSILRRVKDGFPLTVKQLNLLESMASGEFAERRQKARDKEEDRGFDRAMDREDDIPW
jgi:hypothetical protein